MPIQVSFLVENYFANRKPWASLTRGKSVPSDVPGLQICSSETNHWIAIEELARPNEVIVFAGEQLEEATGGRVKAARHRVMRDGRPRESVVFELRAPGVR